MWRFFRKIMQNRDESQRPPSNGRNLESHRGIGFRFEKRHAAVVAAYGKDELGYTSE